MNRTSTAGTVAEVGTAPSLSEERGGERRRTVTFPSRVTARAGARQYHGGDAG